MDRELEALTHALNRLDDFSALGRGLLATSPIVGRALQIGRLEDTPYQRGRVLSRMIRDEVAAGFKRCKASRASSDTAEWSILYLRVHEGRTLGEIARILEMPRRSVDRYYGRAKDLLLDRLLDLEVTIRAPGFYCPLCGEHLTDDLVGLAADYACTSCGAVIHAEAHAGDEISIRVRRRP